MNWIPLTTIEQLDLLRERSADFPQVIFKHSTRCQISTVTKSRLDKNTVPENIDFYYLDLLKYRHISNAIAEQFSVQHESPQILIIKDGSCFYNESHLSIHMDEILEQVH